MKSFLLILPALICSPLAVSASRSGRAGQSKVKVVDAEPNLKLLSFAPLDKKSTKQESSSSKGESSSRRKATVAEAQPPFKLLSFVPLAEDAVEKPGEAKVEEIDAKPSLRMMSYVPLAAGDNDVLSESEDSEAEYPYFAGDADGDEADPKSGDAAAAARLSSLLETAVEEALSKLSPAELVQLEKNVLKLKRSGANGDAMDEGNAVEAVEPVGKSGTVVDAVPGDEAVVDAVLAATPGESDEAAVFDAVVALAEQASQAITERVASDNAPGFQMIVENDNAPATDPRAKLRLHEKLDFSPLVIILIFYILSLYFTF